MGTVNASYRESKPPVSRSDWAEGLDLELSRAFEQIKRSDDEDPTEAELADDPGFMIVIWPDEFR